MQQNAAISERDNALLKCDNAIAALQSGFLEVESSYAFGCKAPDDNALSINGRLSCDGTRHNVDTYLDIDDQCISPASGCGKISIALRLIFPLKSRSLYQPVSDVQNSKSDCFKLFQKQLEVMPLWLWICPHDQVAAPTPKMKPDRLLVATITANLFDAALHMLHEDSELTIVQDG